MPVQEAWWNYPVESRTYQQHTHDHPNDAIHIAGIAGKKFAHYSWTFFSMASLISLAPSEIFDTASRIIAAAALCAHAIH